MASEQNKAEHGGVLWDQLQVHGLVAAGLAYPVYGFIQKNPVYLVANRVSPGQLLVLIAIVSVLVPLCLGALPLLVRRFSGKIYTVLMRTLMFGLVLLCLLPLFNEAEGTALWVSAALCGVGAALLTRECAVNSFVYYGVALLSALAALLPLQFALDSNVRSVLMPQSADAGAQMAAANDDRPTVVLVVFDEFPLVHLLDAEGRIDGSRFPNFGAFTEEATWYSNGTTVHDQTMKAVPAILTGRYPVEEFRLPTAQSYPDSLFSLLRGTHQVHARERVTHLYTQSIGTEADYAISTAGFFSDIGIFYARSLLPKGPADRLFPIQDGIWGGFLENMPEPEEAEDRDALIAWMQADRERARANNEYGNRYHAAQSFIGEMESFPKNTLHYLHIIIPHGPYSFLPSGKSYNFSEPAGADAQERVRAKRAAHMLQVGLADTILGELKAELVRLGRWDDALVVVTGDHGEAYEPGKNHRLVTPTNFGSVAFVPLMVKCPDQGGGRTDSANAQTIDIVPTILDVLELGNPPRLDGKSLRGVGREPNPMKRVYSDSGKVFEYSQEVYREARAKAHREAVEFFSLEHEKATIFQQGAGLDFLGTPLASHRARWVPSQLGIYSASELAEVDKETDLVPAQVSGEITQLPNALPEDAVVAVAVNGIVQGVAKPYLAGDEKYRFLTVLDEAVIQEKNVVEAALLRTEN